MLSDADGGSQLTADHFERAWWEARGAVIGEAAGRGRVVFVRSGERTWALRHYRRGGWAARLSDDRYAWTGLERTRPWREWRLTAALFDQGLPVPRPIGARVRRGVLAYRGDLLTERIEGAVPLAELLQGRVMNISQWTRIGQMLRRFHEAGVRHGDINARNILRDAEGRFYLIDFDKARIEAPGPWQAENLLRFHRSLDKFRRTVPGFRFDEIAWQGVLSGYHARP